MDEKDLKDGQEKDHEEESSSEQTPAPVKEDVKNTQEEDKEEDIDSLVDELLADGTSARKKVSIPYDKFDEVNSKAKLYDAFSPTLVKLQENPDVIDRLINGESSAPIMGEEGKRDTVTLKKRIAQLEEESRVKKIQETKSVLSEAVSLWGKNFTSRWNDMKSIVSSLEKQGFTYKDSVQRAYFAVHPEAIKEEKHLIEVKRASDVQNAKGIMKSSGAAFHPEEEENKDYPTDSDRDFAGKQVSIGGIVLTPKLYAKHKEYIRDKGLI